MKAWNHPKGQQTNNLLFQFRGLKQYKQYIFGNAIVIIEKVVSTVVLDYILLVIFCYFDVILVCIDAVNLVSIFAK